MCSSSLLKDTAVQELNIDVACYVLSAFGHSWSSAFILPSAALGVPNLKDPFAEALVPDVSGALSWLARIALDWLARIALDWRARVALNWLARVAVGWRASVPLDWRAWIDDFGWCARVAWVGINNLLWGIARVAWIGVNNLHRFCIFFFQNFLFVFKIGPLLNGLDQRIYNS